MDYPTRTRTGTAFLDRLVLTGWGASSTNVTSLYTWTDGGRLWWVFTQSSGDLSFYRRKTAGSGDKVCSGTVSNGLVTLSAANTSGITGTAELTTGDFSGALANPSEDATGDILVSYADENDLIDAAQGVGNILDSNSKWYAQGTRWESLLLRTRLTFDDAVSAKVSNFVDTDQTGKPMLCQINEPRKLAKAHAMYVVSELMRHRAGADQQRMEAANMRRGWADNELANVTLSFDRGADRVADSMAALGQVRLTRG